MQQPEDWHFFADHQNLLLRLNGSFVGICSFGHAPDLVADIVSNQQGTLAVEGHAHRTTQSLFISG
jgi:hypothetical protein